MTLFSIFQTALIVLLVVLVIVFAGVLSSKNPEWIFSLLGIAQNEEPKYEALKFLGIGMGGVLVALQALMAYKRAKAMEDTAKAQADAVSKTEQGQRQDRLKNAIEHLGHKKDSVRLGGAYELFHLAEDTEDLRQTVLDILCAHIRRTTGEIEYQEEHYLKPSEEVQSLLTLLFVQKHKVFKGCHINLQGSWLQEAELSGAHLQKAELSGAHLQWAKLSGAHLQEAELSGAHLQKAELSGAHLQEAELSGAHLQEAELSGAHLQEADIVIARLDGANLCNAQLQGANLGVTCLRGADLWDAQLQGVNLATAQLQGANLGGVGLQGANLADTQMHGVRCEEDISDSFEQRMRESISQESDLSWVIFAGGLSEDDVDSLVKDLNDKKASELRKKLTPHIGKRKSNKLSKNSGAITGSYTEEEAEQWIAQFKDDS